MSPAYNRGAARARFLRSLERRGIIGAAVNPYKRPAGRAQWESGFRAAYYGKES